MILDGYQAIKLKKFQIKELALTSRALKNNPLKDPAKRHMPILVPKQPKAVVWVLAGFSGNGPNYLNLRGFEANFAQNLESWKDAPEAVYVFVDAWSKIGGSQFINSKGVGRYEDYIVEDLYPVINTAFPNLKHAIMGGSSGGYGALHLASKYPLLFTYCGAIAPDAGFESLFLPEFYKTAPYFLKNKVSINKIADLMERRDWHSILNVYGMSLCYSNGKIPFDFYTGQLIQSEWKKWLALDPVHFLPKRKAALKKIKGLYLEVGNKDQFHLQFGVRQIHAFLKTQRIKHHYQEFSGNHFDLSTRREGFLSWLNKNI